ncbi:MAG: amidohydrolase family protein [Clostridia bacterium]|nr:amidohydrolase family protein [Clostridia bacterium]
MNNPQKNGYLEMPIWEGHCHCMMYHKAERTAELFRRIMEYYEYERITICAIVNESDADHPADNAVAFYVKSKLNAEKPNSVYVYGNIEHYYDERDTADGYLEQVKRLVAMGADGIKLLDGKTADRKRLNRRLDDPIFDKMYAYIVEQGLTVTSHVGDPRANWDITKVSEYARKKGWYYDETYPTLDELYAEVDGVLTKFPKLKLNLAHFYFIADDYDGAVAMMEKWENVSFDLTPGGEMFVHFTADHDKWRAFFTKYADRITYGTDTYNQDPGPSLDDYENCAAAGRRINQLRTMLEKTEPFDDPHFGHLVPLGLDREVLEKIYYKNVLKNNGDSKPLGNALIAQYCKDMLCELESGVIKSGDDNKQAMDVENLKTIAAWFEK